MADELLHEPVNEIRRLYNSKEHCYICSSKQLGMQSVD